MNDITTENTFETAIVESLTQEGGYLQGNAKGYNSETGMFQQEVLTFIKDTQPKNWKKLSSIHGDSTQSRLIQRLEKQMDSRGALDVIRNGFVEYGVKFRLAFFKPEAGLNPETIALYNCNRLTVTRQLYYSKKNKNSVDLVLSLNGIPVATIELKNHFTGQNTTNAKKQYTDTRDKRDILFAFKKRCLVHFAVDDEEVYMTTRIEGDKTYWLPFNKGYNNGKGNPPNPEGYKTEYLWRNILAKESWLDIIGRFIHLQTESIISKGKTSKKEKMIFPRYHQLDAVRKMSCHVKEHGAGQNYLVQHSAGSGKSNSIAWLSYRLAGLHNSENERIFHSVVVVTDRRVLDSQLQDTIYQFEHKTGVVQRIDKDSNQLAEAISSGVSIIITTLQKFPFVVDKVKNLPKRNYAIIIDEAHSSQGGKATTKMKDVLTSGEDEKYRMVAETPQEYEVDTDEEDAEDFIRKQVKRSATARGQHANLSFFAFTATPKYKTLAVFGHKDKKGNPQPFHLYSMRQAIEEGFILDVLQNYTNYELYFQLNKSIEADPKMNKKKAKKAITRFVSLHPYNLAQKAEIIIEHFRQIVSKKIGGKAKAMLVSSSRLHARRYFEEFKRYIKKNGYEKDIKILVAFSGTIKDKDDPDEGVTEAKLNGFGEKELPKQFEKDTYKILIVADKYQTGFDQPLLHTLYVDKPLSGVKAVQTLSRLNRTAPGKDDTFVLDFVNKREDILSSFQPYYEMTTVTEEPSPNHLYDLKDKLDEYHVYLDAEIEAFVKVYFAPSLKKTARAQKKLYAHIDPAVDRFRNLEKEKQDELKKSLRTWTNLYAFLAQIMPFQDLELEKFYAYAKLLQTKLPRGMTTGLNITDEVALEYYRLEKMKEGAIELVKGQEGQLSGIAEAGMKKEKEEKALLSEIIKTLNERFSTDFDENDKLFFEQIEGELLKDEKLQVQAKVNKIDNFQYAFKDIFESKLVERMDQNQEIFEKIIGDEAFGNFVKELMMQSVYSKLNQVVG